MWAHLQLIFQWAYQMNPSFTSIHMERDGAVTQYKNKTMFHMISQSFKFFYKICHYLHGITQNQAMVRELPMGLEEP